MMKVVIVIPVYAVKLNRYEEISIMQCKRVFHNYPIRLLNPAKLNLNYYYELFNGHQDFDNISFSTKFFQSPQTYNLLLKTLIFYKALAEYDFFLMYHTDAFAFRDEINYWSTREYDIIGAPLYEYNGSIEPKTLLGIGNSGFSLHKISSSIQVLQTLKKVYPFTDVFKNYSDYNLKGKLWHLPYLIRMAMGLGGWSHYLLNYSRLNEDIFWGIQVPAKFPLFKVAPFGEAYKFSMEYNCKELFSLNNSQLPFGCHQWYKGKFLDFWKDKIEAQGYDLG